MTLKVKISYTSMSCTGEWLWNDEYNIDTIITSSHVPETLSYNMIKFNQQECC